MPVNHLVAYVFLIINKCKILYIGKENPKFDYQMEDEDEMEHYQNSCLASGNFCCLLITFANSLNPDQDRHNVVTDLGSNRLEL